MSTMSSTRAVQHLFDRVQLPASALTVVRTGQRGRLELLVWVDEGFRSVLKDFPKRIDGAIVRAEVRPSIVARSSAID
jgi:hypothetical protein